MEDAQGSQGWAYAAYKDDPANVAMLTEYTDKQQDWLERLGQLFNDLVQVAHRQWKKRRKG